ncbi:MAG: hypothetical protein PVI65_00495 [Desulfobacterales bacterium]
MMPSAVPFQPYRKKHSVVNTWIAATYVETSAEPYENEDLL